MDKTTSSHRAEEQERYLVELRCLGKYHKQDNTRWMLIFAKLVQMWPENLDQTLEVASKHLTDHFGKIGPDPETLLHLWRIYISSIPRNGSGEQHFNYIQHLDGMKPQMADYRRAVLKKMLLTPSDPVIVEKILPTLNKKARSWDGKAGQENFIQDITSEILTKACIQDNYAGVLEQLLRHAKRDILIEYQPEEISLPIVATLVRRITSTSKKEFAMERVEFVLDRILEWGADMEERASTGETPLQYLGRVFQPYDQRHVLAVNLLVIRGARCDLLVEGLTHPHMFELPVIRSAKNKAGMERIVNVKTKKRRASPGKPFI